MVAESGEISVEHPFYILRVDDSAPATHSFMIMNHDSIHSPPYTDLATLNGKYEKTWMFSPGTSTRTGSKRE
jgi:hypothetical protein